MDTMGTDSLGKTRVKHHECVAEAAVIIFNATCGTQLWQQEEDGTLTSDGIVVAVISLVGGVDWSIFLGLPQETALALVPKFAGFEIPYDSGDMGDAVGELTNILAGEVKSQLDRKGIEANISVPSVFRAESINFLEQSNVEAFRTCFGTPVGTLWTGIIARVSAAGMT